MPTTNNFDYNDCSLRRRRTIRDDYRGIRLPHVLTVQLGLARFSWAPVGSVRLGRGSARPELRNFSPARPGSTRLGLVRLGLARFNLAPFGSAWLCSGWLGLASLGSNCSLALLIHECANFLWVLSECKLGCKAAANRGDS